MQVIATPLDGVLILAPKVFGDARRLFSKASTPAVSRN